MNIIQENLKKDRQALLDALTDAGANIKKPTEIFCPFHDNTNTPAGSIKSDDNGHWRYRCFSCGASGDIFDIRARANNTSVETELKKVSDNNRKYKNVNTKNKHIDTYINSSVNVSNSNNRHDKTYKTAQEAIDVLESKRGKCSKSWTYNNIEGKPIGVVCRWDKRGGSKDILPISLIGDNWQIKAMPETRPLYRLPELIKSDTTIYICEGEKSADAATSIGLNATTNAGGSNAVDKTDWQPLAGREVVLLPDNDNAGDKWTDALLKKLPTPEKAKVIKLVDLGLPDSASFEKIKGGDIADLVSGDNDLDTGLREAIDMAVDDTDYYKPEPKDEPERLTFKPFPVDALPNIASDFVQAGAKAIGCDTSYLALPMLSMLAACIGTTRCLQLKNTWQELPIIWTTIIGESGTLKTPAFKLVMKSIRKLQHREIIEYEQKLELYKQELVDYEKDLKAYKKNKHSDQPKEPQAPVCSELLVKDITVEALAETLKNNQRGLLLETDEIAGWINSFNSYKSGKGGDAQHYLSMHSGEPIKINRKTGNNKIIYVPTAAVSITGGIQPETLKRCLSSEHRENGLAARLLMAKPPRKPKRWDKNRSVSPQLKNDLASLINELIKLQSSCNQFDEPEPQKLVLTAKAEKLWGDFFNEHSDEQNELTGDLAAAYSKLEAGAARLALVVQLANNPQAEAVDADSMSAGIDLANWFKHEAKRIYNMLCETEQDQSQRELIELIQRKGGDISARELKQSSRAYKKLSTADIEQELGGLVEAGYGHWQQPKQTGRGMPKAKRFYLVNSNDDFNTVNASTVNTNTPTDSASGNSVDVDTVDIVINTNTVNGENEYLETEANGALNNQLEVLDI